MKPNPVAPGKFIVLEGPDGCGKTTQAKLLCGHLEGKGIDIVLTEEPTKSSSAALAIRRVLEKKEDADPRRLQEFFVRDREEHVTNVILPALQEGKTVISVRYLFSTVVYGSISVKFEDLVAMNSKFPLPDLTLVLRVRPETAIARINARGESPEFFEEEKKIRHVAETYEQLPQIYPNVQLINAERSVKEVSEDISLAVNALLS